MQNGWIAKEEVESQVPSWGRGVKHKVAAPYLVLFQFMYIVQLYKEDWSVLRMFGCRAVALPYIKQIVSDMYIWGMYVYVPHMNRVH